MIAANALEDAGLSQLDLRVYDLIIQEGPSPRGEIVQKLSVPRTTVYDSLKKLEGMGLVGRRPHYHFGPMKRGRPEVIFYLVGRDDRA